MCVSGSVNYSYHTEIKDAIAGVPNGGLSLSTTVSPALFISLSRLENCFLTDNRRVCTCIHLCVCAISLFALDFFTPRDVSRPSV